MRYQEAISLAKDPKDKATIRQKLAIELGKLWRQSNPQKAKRLFSRAWKIADGEPAFVELAAKQMRLLGTPL